MTEHYPCDLATETGVFGVFDCRTGEALKIETDAACRRLAERRYPGCKFLLTTMSAVYEANPDGPPPPTIDMVIIAVCLPASDGTQAVHAYIFGAVHSERCVPFTPAVWPDAYDLLTRRN